MTTGETPREGADKPVKGDRPRRLANAMLVVVRLIQVVYWLIRIDKS